jgi:hypothetical protein
MAISVTSSFSPLLYQCILQVQTEVDVSVAGSGGPLAEDTTLLAFTASQVALYLFADLYGCAVNTWKGTFLMWHASWHLSILTLRSRVLSVIQP